MPPKPNAALTIHGLSKRREIKRSASSSSVHPLTRRSASSASLHPLTKKHNQTLAKSTGSLFEQHDEVIFEGFGCRCRVCRSPRGAWRKDSLGSEVAHDLERLKPTKCDDAEVEVVTVQASPKRRMNKARAESDSLDWDSFAQPTFDVRPRIARPATAKAKLVDVVQDRSANEETLAGDSGGKCIVRPSTAPIGGRGEQKTKRELRTEAARERKRLLNEGFVERCRTAWDAKMAICESRQKEVAANALAATAAMEAKRIATKMQIDMNQRAQQWIMILKILAVFNYFHELVVSGRVFHFASIGDQSMQQAMKWGHMPAEHESKFAGANSKVWKKLRVAFMISSTFPSVRRLCMKGPPEMDNTEASQELEREIHERLRNWKLWSVALNCLWAIARLKRRCKYRKAGRILATVLSQMAVTNTMYLSIRVRFIQIRLLQTAVRRWIKREKERRKSLAELFVKVEHDTLRRNWAEADLRLIRDEKQRLAKLRTVKERSTSERMISLARERYRSYMKPKTELDFIDLENKLAKHRLPIFVQNLCTYNAYAERKLLIKRKLDDQAQKFEAYEREKRCWDDIEEAVRIIDPTGRNPDPVPEPPPSLPLFHFTIEESIATSIMLAVRAWCEENVEIVESSVAEVSKGSSRSLDFFKSREIIKRLPCNLSQINSTVRRIVKSALFSVE